MMGARWLTSSPHQGLPHLRDAEFQFDVVVRPAPDPVSDWSPEQREAQSAALAQDIEAAQAAVLAIYAKAFLTTAAAEATAIRSIN